MKHERLSPSVRRGYLKLSQERSRNERQPGMAGQFRQRLRTRTGRKGALILGTLPGGAGVSYDPAVTLALWIRSALHPDQWRRPSPCRVYNPDGTLREVLDPFTRKPIP